MVPRIVGTGFARMLLLPATRVGFYDNNSSWDAVSTKVLFTRVLLSKRESPIRASSLGRSRSVKFANRHGNPVLGLFEYDVVTFMVD